VRNLSDPTFATVWYRGHPYPVSAYSSSEPPTVGGAWWYVLLEDGRWHRARERRDGERGAEHWAAVEADIVAWLEQRPASGAAPPLVRPAPAYEPPTRDRALTLRSLAFETGDDAADFIRRLTVLFDGRTTRLLLPSMPVVIYGPAAIDSGARVTLHAGRGALALARYAGLTFPEPGDEVDAESLSGVGPIFGPMSTRPRG
jgi:hypothetical protein